jgi:hypothetical protein
MVSMTAACARPAKPAVTPAETATAALPETATATPKPVEMTPNAGTASPAGGKAGGGKATAARPVPRAADSLAGHDRHLVHRPFDVVEASDFELGPLSPGGTAPEVAASLARLEKGLLDGKLPDSLFASDAARVASVFLSEGLAAMPGPVSVRFSAPLTQPGGTIASGVRIIAAEGSSVQNQALEVSALGMVILSPADDGSLLVAHLELDLPSRWQKTVRTKPWDPYALHQAP